MRPNNSRPPRLMQPEPPPGKPHGRPRSQNMDEDGIADPATLNFIKRTLCPSKSGEATNTTVNALDDLLPPLTSSNRVDVQLYAIIAVIMAQFVQSWYNRITTDEVFTAEVVQIIAHCCRGLEGRLRDVDLELLIFHEIPQIVDAHLQAARIANELDDQTNARTVANTPLSQSFGSTFHALRPHLALSPPPSSPKQAATQRENETAWCQLLVNSVLPLLVPPEDFTNPCLRALVSEIFSELIFLNAICGRASEPWLLWEGITRLTSLLKASPEPENGIATPRTTTQARSASERLEQYGLLAPPTSSRTTGAMKPSSHALDPFVRLFWSAAQTMLTGWNLICMLITVLRLSRSFSARESLNTSKGHATVTEYEATPRPMLSMGVWSCVSHLILLPQRMPWLSGLLELVHWFLLHGPGRLCRTNSKLDRILSAQWRIYLLDRPSLLPAMLASLRAALFPNNIFVTSSRPPPSSQAEIDTIRRECAEALVEVIPSAIRTRFFATSDCEAMADDVDRTVCALLRDRYVNKHLIVALTELVAVRVFPELLEMRDPSD